MATKIQTKEQTKIKTKEPKRYRVVVFNDDFTTMDFVVDMLAEVFRKTQEEAEQIMMSIHKKGRATVGVYSYDIAKSRALKAISLARNEGFPLRIEVEPE